MMTVRISIVIPLYACAGSINELYHRLVCTLESIVGNEFEIILVNDASPLNDWEVVSSIAIQDSRVVGINLSRNFGQHYAITAGIDHVKGDYLVVMDGDLQDQPEEIVKLYNEVNKGVDIVYARRANRQDGFLKKKSSQIFYKVFDYFTDRNSDESIANFSIVNQKVIQTFRSMKEQNRMYPLFLNWMGFKVAYVDVVHASRQEGESSYNLYRLLKLASNNIISNSNKPLKLGVSLGFTITLVSLFVGLFLLLGHFLNWFEVEGWVSTMISIWFVGGLLSFNLGLIGVYIGKIFDETKNRPIYLVGEILNEKKELCLKD